MKERLLENSEISKALRQCDELCCAARQQLEESKVGKLIRSDTYFGIDS